MLRLIALASLLALSACATTTATPAGPAPVAANPNDRCVHGVACETCVKCHPELAARFKAAGWWCPEHGVPESQCGICHPEVVMAAPKPPEGADFKILVENGDDISALNQHVVACNKTI